MIKGVEKLRDCVYRNKQLAKFGKAVSRGEDLAAFNHEMSEEHALWLQTTSRGMSRTGYQDLRATLQQNQLAELPGWNKTKDYRDQVCSNLNAVM